MVAAFATALLLVPAIAAAGLVINEIDYDQPGTDAAEYFELKNNGPGSVDLSEYTVELVNGSSGGAVIYTTVSTMTGTLAEGDYYVVCATGSGVPNCDLSDLVATNAIQNGSPDAIGLRHLGTLVDAVSYEGASGAPYIEGTGTTASDDNASADMGIARYPDGTDTDNNDADFVFQANTPGASNGPVAPAAGPIALGLGALLLAMGGGWMLLRRRTA